jgi:hypothetical protein
VAIDEDWSALRFRRTEFVKTMTRPVEYRYSEHGRARGDRLAGQRSRVKSKVKR